MDDQVIRLVLKTSGQETIEGLRKSTANYQALLVNLVKQFNAGEIDAARFEAETRKLDAEYQRQAALLDKLTAAYKAEADAANAAADAQKKQADAAADAAVKTEAAAAKAGRSAMNLNRVGIETGRIVQDFFQGGVGGILNNIEGITTALGYGAGLAGALTIVGVAAVALKPVIAEVFKSFGSDVDFGRTRVEELTEKIKELEEKPHKVAVDFTDLVKAREELEKLKQAEAEAKRQASLDPPRKGEVKKKVDEAIAGQAGGGAAVAEAMDKVIASWDDEANKKLTEIARQRGEAQKSLDGWDGGVRGAQAAGMAQQRIKQLDQEEAAVRAQAMQKAKGVRGAIDATTPEGAAQFADIARTAGLNGLADKVQAATRDVLGEHVGKVFDGFNKNFRDVVKEKAKAIGEKDKAAKEAGQWFDKAAEDVDQQQAVKNRANGDWFDKMAGQVDDAMQKAAGDKADKKKADADREEKRQRAREEKRFDDRIGTLVKTLQSTPIDENATAAAAQLRASGRSEFDQFGILMESLQKRIMAEGGVNRMDAGAAAVRMAKTAFDKADANRIGRAVGAVEAGQLPPQLVPDPAAGGRRGAVPDLPSKEDREARAAAQREAIAERNRAKLDRGKSDRESIARRNADRAEAARAERAAIAERNQAKQDRAGEAAVQAVALAQNNVAIAGASVNVLGQLSGEVARISAQQQAIKQALGDMFTKQRQNQRTQLNRNP